MVEGESGVLAVSPAGGRPTYEPSKRRLTWPNGAIATTYSADEPERLRGPQHDCAWCDEMGAWRYPEAWDMLMNLTRKQERFVQEYLLDLNATQAAIRAGYSAKAARVAGCKNITKANIASAAAPISRR